MSAVLIVTKDKKQVAKVAITSDSFVVGRTPNCNLPLDEALASREHAELVLERGSYWVRDRGSRNGTSVNGEKLASRHELKDGDEIEIGSTRLKFVWDKSREEEAADDDRTRVASIADLGKKASGLRVVKKKDHGNFEVKVRVADGPLQGGVFRNWESPLTIGRGLDNNIVLLDDAVSTAHAQIIQEGEEYFIIDLKSSNGTFLDGVKVQKTRLQNGHKIKVGVSTLVFDLVDLGKRRKHQKIALISATAVIVISLLIKLLQPADVAGQHIDLGQNYEQQGEFAKALDEYEAALKVDSNRPETKLYLAKLKQKMEAREVLALAEREATAENYDKAKELVYRVLRDFPNSSRAQELQAVIKSIENAKIAFTARNWADAKRLLEKAQETYPKSELLRRRLDQAQKELTAQQNLAQANDALQHQQLDMAQPLFESISANSVYYTEARQALDEIAKSRKVTAYLSRAQAFYRDGHITDALTEIDAGLAQASDSNLLLSLQKRVRQIEALAKPLEIAEALSQPNDVNVLLRDRKVCEDVIALENDPLNDLYKRAQAAATRIDEKLVQGAQASVVRAAALELSGNRKEALRLYELAVRAKPDDQSVVELRDKLRLKIVADCRTLYQQGIVHEELGQSELARSAFQSLLNIGIPGEDYYERATRKLKAFSP